VSSLREYKYATKVSIDKVMVIPREHHKLSLSHLGVRQWKCGVMLASETILRFSENINVLPTGSDPDGDRNTVTIPSSDNSNVVAAATQ
jgi:hypothetical protein